MKRIAGFLLGVLLLLIFSGTTMAAPVAVNEEGQLSAFVELGGIGIGYGLTDTMTIHVQTPWLTGISADLVTEIGDSTYLRVEGDYLLGGLAYGVSAGTYIPLTADDNFTSLVGSNIVYVSVYDGSEYINGVGVTAGIELQYKISETAMVYGDLNVGYTYVLNYGVGGVGIGYTVGVNIGF